MTRDELHHQGAPSEKHTFAWFRTGVADRGGEPHAESMQVKVRRRRPMSEARATQEMEVCLEELLKSEAIDVEALVAAAKEEQQEDERNTFRTRVKVAVTLMSLFAAVGLTLFHAYADYYVSGDQPRLISLKDGSQVELNVDSAIKVRFSATTREVILTKGEAIFKVRSDQRRPFWVRAGEIIFEAVGTQFDVRRTGDRTILTMVEGVVQLRPVSSLGNDAPARAELRRITAGFSLTVDREGRAGSAVPVDALAVTAWRKHVGLVFTDATLAEIAEAFNRHHAKPRLIIEGKALRARRFAISFNSASAEELVKYLKNDESLIFISTRDEVLIRERKR